MQRASTVYINPPSISQSAGDSQHHTTEGSSGHTHVHNHLGGIPLLTEYDVVRLGCDDCRRMLFFEDIYRKPKKLPAEPQASGKKSSDDFKSAIADNTLRVDDEHRDITTTESAPGVFYNKQRPSNVKIAWGDNRKQSNHLRFERDQPMTQLPVWLQSEKREPMPNYGSVHCPKPMTQYLDSAHIAFRKHRILRPATAPGCAGSSRTTPAESKKSYILPQGDWQAISEMWTHKRISQGENMYNRRMTVGFSPDLGRQSIAPSDQDLRNSRHSIAGMRRTSRSRSRAASSSGGLTTRAKYHFKIEEKRSSMGSNKIWTTGRWGDSGGH